MADDGTFFRLVGRLFLDIKYSGLATGGSGGRPVAGGTCFCGDEFSTGCLCQGRATVCFVTGSVVWPLLEYALSPELVFELLLLLTAGALLVLVKSSAPAPALILSMSATALALCTALAGSLLIAQLAGALAAAAGVFAIVELGGRLNAPALPVSRLLPLALLYFLLLAIARFYADLSTGPALLLLLAPLSLRLPHRLAPGGCLLMLVSAAVWIFMLQDSNSYY